MLEIESLPLESLHPDPRNARKHSDENINAIAKSLEMFGQRKPVVITSDNVIVAGNGTVAAARLIGVTDLDVVRVPSSWSADQVKAFALADNRTAELAEWDKEILAEQLLDLEEESFSLTVLGFDPTPELDFAPVDSDDNPALDERIKHECPHCRGVFEIKNGKPQASG